MAISFWRHVWRCLFSLRGLEKQWKQRPSFGESKIDRTLEGGHPCITDPDELASTEKLPFCTPDNASVSKFGSSPFLGRESIVRWTISVFGLRTTLQFSHPKSMSLSFENPNWSSSWFLKTHRKSKKNHPQTRHQSFLTCRSMPNYSKSSRNSMVLLLPDGTTSKAVIFIVDVGKVYVGFWSNFFGWTSSLPSQPEKDSENNCQSEHFWTSMSSHSSSPLFLRSK